MSDTEQPDADLALPTGAVSGMEVSICLDDESLLSPDSEQPPPGDISPLAQLDRPEPPLEQVRRVMSCCVISDVAWKKLKTSVPRTLKAPDFTRKDLARPR